MLGFTNHYKVSRSELLEIKQSKARPSSSVYWSIEQLNNMYNVNITGAFTGVFPSTITISARSHAAAVKHYRTVLRAKQVTSGPKTVLESAYGFRFRIDASNSSSSRTCVRLGLPSNVSREAIARALGGSASRPRKGRSGTTVSDRFGVTWTLA